MESTPVSPSVSALETTLARTRRSIATENKRHNFNADRLAKVESDTKAAIIAVKKQEIEALGGKLL